MESGKPLSRRHPLVRRLRVLRRDAGARREQRVLVAEGLHLAREALDAGAGVELALVSPRLDASGEGRDLRRRLAQAGVTLHHTTDDVLDSVQDARSAQPVLLVVRRPEVSWEALWRARPGPALVLVAHGVQDPGNLGAMLRSADAAGATGFVACGGGADLYHPRAVRAGMGSSFRLPALSAAEDDALRELRDRGVRSLGTAPAGGRRYDALELTGPVALWLGGEGGGVPPAVQARMDDVVHIPMHDGVDSLSVSAAAAVLLFEAARQRRGDNGGRAYS